MEDLEKRIRELACKAASKEKIFSFLRLFSHNVGLSLENLLLVWEQREDALTVCGRRAWEQLGRLVKDDAVSMQILFPELLPDGSCNMRNVCVFNYADTVGADLEKSVNVSLADRITLITGISWEVVPEEVLQASLKLGLYNKKENVFYISKGCAGESKQLVVLELYLDYVLEVEHIEDKLVRMAVLFVLYEYFGMPNKLISALFGKIDRLDEAAKVQLLRTVILIGRKLVDDLVGYTLSFNETAYINSLLSSGNKEDMKKDFEDAIKNCKCEVVCEELALLQKKLENVAAHCLEGLFQKKCQRKLFSYPPEELVYDDAGVRELVRVKKSGIVGEDLF